MGEVTGPEAAPGGERLTTVTLASLEPAEPASLQREGVLSAVAVGLFQVVTGDGSRGSIMIPGSYAETRSSIGPVGVGAQSGRICAPRLVIVDEPSTVRIPTESEL
jgi:hypothetical protein